ncbi:MAG TPA: isoleucine--tRNA ligase [Beijerinckiaceae bacterium]|nr:isoleucine--tRNA ligase [Beijerinckiaceae bacterium]
MTDSKPAARESGPDYAQTLFLPKTDFPMRGGLPQKEPALLARWAEIDLYGRLRAAGAGRDKFVLHDGPPYANGNIHIGHALNKILKDLVTRSQQMLGKDSNYVPGWDCHGLPIEWKIEEEYRAKGRTKPDFSDPAAMVAFRRECRAFAEHWLQVQREEFKRLGVTGDWDHPYTTMDFHAEAQIARELMKFAANGLLYRGSKPVMWSVVEKTALAEAEVEYEDYTSDTVFVAFPLSANSVVMAGLDPAIHDSPANDVDGRGKPGHDATVSIVIWTTTPWTIPGNRAIAFSSKISYGLYRVTEAPEGNWAKVGARYILADKLAEEVFKAAKVTVYQRVQTIDSKLLAIGECDHSLAKFNDGYRFIVPLLEGDYVTDDTGTGFVHSAPGHGREDFDLWTAHARELQLRGIETRIPFMVDADGFYTKDAPGFEGRRVLDDKGNKGDANQAVMDALVQTGNLVARGRLKHPYPHSWRSKKPVIFRNTPQWFIAMDQPIGARTLRDIALRAIGETEWVPASGENRIRGMIANRPDWVVSRQRAWGVPIAVFVNKETQEILRDEKVNARIAGAFEQEGADAWFEAGAAARFLAPDYDPAHFEKIADVLDVWFDSGSTHAFTLEDPIRFPGLANIKRKAVGGADEVMYLEGSDQHRGWFHSSLLESCGTRGRAPYDVVLTHGFVLDERGRKMSKSFGNVVAPQTVIKDSGADILRLWVAAADYSDDLRIGKEILGTFVETYRKLRNTLRWMLGALTHYESAESIGWRSMGELDQLMLHRLAEIDPIVREAYASFDYKKVVATLAHFMTSDLSAFYFDIRKDTLYCDPLSSAARLGALEALDWIFRCLTTWLAPILCFTCEEAWLSRFPEALSVHLETFPDIATEWLNPDLADKWARVRRVRSVVTGALELERAAKRIGSSLEAAPRVFIADDSLKEALRGVDFAEICITSAIEIEHGEGPADAFRLAEVAGVSVTPDRASGEKCARSWKVSPLVGADPEFPDVTPRDAQALRELIAAGRWEGPRA